MYSLVHLIVAFINILYSALSCHNWQPSIPETAGWYSGSWWYRYQMNGSGFNDDNMLGFIVIFISGVSSRPSVRDETNSLTNVYPDSTLSAPELSWQRTPNDQALALNVEVTSGSVIFNIR